MTRALVVLCAVAALTLTLHTSDALTHCQFVRKVRAVNVFDPSQIQKLACIARYSSGYRTSLQTTAKDGSHQFGILQINDKDWCSTPWPRIGCDKRCRDFLDADITDDVRCARIIYNTRGFSAWSVYNEHCKTNAPHIGQC